jgi:hypothetical protein
MFDVVKIDSGKMGTWLGILLLSAALILNFLFERHGSFESWGNLFASTVCFLTFGIGAAVLIGAVFRVQIQRLLLFAFPIILSSAILYLVFYIGVQSVQTGADRLGECPELYQAAASANVIPPSQWRPDLPALGCEVERRGMFLSYYNSVGIHGVTDPAAQERILGNLTEHYRLAHAHPIRVMFYEKENWITRRGKNGTISGSRGPEKLIRVVNIG